MGDELRNQNKTNELTMLVSLFILIGSPSTASEINWEISSE
jgi:hypothetical protein